MLYERDDPIPRDDRLVIGWQRLILVLLLLVLLCAAVTAWFVGSPPIDALPPFTTTALEFYVA
jgi:hypothetical protein